jgi:hypothetical protein
MKKNRTILIVLFITVLVACNSVSDKQSIKINVQKDTTLILEKTLQQGNIWGIDLEIHGNFVDTVVLIHTNGNNVSYKYQLIGGVDSIYRTDWYSDSCLIKFENVKKPIMDLEIEYEFFD